jgi:hypothetical protein
LAGLDPATTDPGSAPPPPLIPGASPGGNHGLSFASGNEHRSRLFCTRTYSIREEIVSGLIYLIGLIVVILFILSFLGLR